MELRPIQNKRENQAALKEAESLWVAPDGSAKADRLEDLTLLIEAYEREHAPIADSDPIDLILHVMEARGLTRKDSEPFIVTRARVAEALNRVRPLTLDLPTDLPVGGYDVKQAAWRPR